MKSRISEINVTPIKPKNGLVAFASFIFDDCFHFGSIGIMTRPQGGYRLSYPTRPMSGLHIYFPINREIAREIESAVIDHFESMQQACSLEYR